MVWGLWGLGCCGRGKWRRWGGDAGDEEEEGGGEGEGEYGCLGGEEGDVGGEYEWGLGGGGEVGTGGEGEGGGGGEDGEVVVRSWEEAG